MRRGLCARCCSLPVTPVRLGSWVGMGPIQRINQPLIHPARQARAIALAPRAEGLGVAAVVHEATAKCMANSTTVNCSKPSRWFDSFDAGGRTSRVSWWPGLCNGSR